MGEEAKAVIVVLERGDLVLETQPEALHCLDVLGRADRLGGIDQPIERAMFAQHAAQIGLHDLFIG
jgi:hypothetical protein